MKISNGKHKILFSCGKLYLDGVQIAGEGIIPSKDVVFEFDVNTPQEENKVEPAPKDSSILEINVHESMKIQGVSPGQQ